MDIDTQETLELDQQEEQQGNLMATQMEESGVNVEFQNEILANLREHASELRKQTAIMREQFEENSRLAKETTDGVTASTSSSSSTSTAQTHAQELESLVKYIQTSLDEQV